MKLNGWKPAAGAVLFYLVIANVPAWLAAWQIGLELRGFFNAEILALGALALLSGNPRWNLLLPGLLVADVVCAVQRTYLMTAGEMLRAAGSLRYYLLSHPAKMGLLLTGAAAVLALGVFSRRVLGPSRAGGIALLLLVAGLFGVDLARGVMLWDRRDVLVSQDSRLLRNVTHRAYLQFLAPIPAHAAGRDAPLTGATVRMVGGLPGAAQPDIVLVVVESWGRSQDPAIAGALTSFYRRPEISASYEVVEGVAPFLGTTVSGEVRELCNSSLSFGVLEASPAALTHCLPQELERRGYSTTAIHGFEPLMFRRAEWYPHIGFQHSWFLPSLRAEGLRSCPGIFPGICDEDIAGWIGRKLRRPESQPSFTYWLTLNSHLPVPSATGLAHREPCPGASPDPVLCRWFQLIAGVHHALSEVAAQGTVRPTVFLIVGDHAPPFSSAGRRQQFSAREVPYVLLTPRSLPPSAPGFHTPHGPSSDRSTRVVLAAASEPGVALPLLHR